MPIDTLSKLSNGSTAGAAMQRENERTGSYSKIGFPRGSLTIMSIIIVDLLALSISIGITIMIRQRLGGEFVLVEYTRLWPMLGVFLILFALSGLYPGVPINPISELQKVAGAVAIVFMIMGVVIFMTHSAAVWSRALFLVACPLSAIAVVLGRNATRHLLGRKEWWGFATVVIGTSQAARAASDSLGSMPWLGLKITSSVDTNEPASNDSLDGLHAPLSMPADLCKGPIHYAIVAMTDGSVREISRIVDRYGSSYKHILFIQDVSGMSSLCLTSRDIGGLLGLEVHQNLLLYFPIIIKRILDLVIIFSSFVFLLPFFLLIGLAIKLDSSGPIIYGQRRIGRGNKHFTAWKFRTMVTNADVVLQEYLNRRPELKEEWKQNHKLHHDPRITKVGKILRRASLDELPQLWNVLQGEMSLVGPRPIVDNEVMKYGTSFALYCKVRPGMSGLWQVSGRSRIGYARRVQLDEYYVRNWSVWLDLYVLARTIGAIWRGVAHIRSTFGALIIQLKLRNGSVTKWLMEF
jgi:Undecaprenyl-phosphate galactose phosphotransferase WbaP